MSKPSILPLVRSFVDQGLLVCYVDDDQDRRRQVLEDNPNKQNLGCMGCTLTGHAALHCNVLITVNEYDFDPIAFKELGAFPGCMNKIYPAIIRITLNRD